MLKKKRINEVFSKEGGLCLDKRREVCYLLENETFRL